MCSGLAVLFAVGLLLASAMATGSQAAGTTTTAPGTTATVQHTTTQRVIVPTPATTTSASNTGNETPAWVWVLLGILALGLVVLVVGLLARRGGGDGGGIPTEERRRRLDAAVGSWTAQGWAIESETADSAVLRRGSELLLVTVDRAGHVTAGPLTAT
jgi:hypothetical protein